MSSKTKKLRFLSLMWDYASALSLIALLILLWHLGKGPIEVNFLRPYIREALTNDTSSYDLDIGSVNLELAHSIQPVNIIAKDVVFKDKKESYTIKAPKLALSFSARALLKGLLAPSSISITDPQISLSISYGLKKDKNQAPELKELKLKKLQFYFTRFEEFLERFNSPEKLYLESFINNIDIKGATLNINESETGRLVSFDNMDLSFNRNITDITITADSAVKFENRTAALDTGLKYRFLDDSLTYTLNFSELVITDLYEALSLKKAGLRAVDIPVNGSFRALIDFGAILKNKASFADSLVQNIKDLSFAIEGGKGKIGFGDSKDFDYDVSSFSLSGSGSGGLDKININKADFDFGGKKAEISLAVTGFKDYLFKNDMQNLKLTFTPRLGAFKVDELTTLWPRYLGHKAWDWCKESLYGGDVKDGSFVFNFGWDEKASAFGLQNLSGTAVISDANLNYLTGMPVIKNVYGTASFTENSITINVDKGISEGVILTGGSVVLSDLNKDDNFIAIDLTGNAAIKDALKLIDHEPLGFTKEIGVNPDDIAGDIDIGLKLNFELKSDLKPEEIKVTVTGDLKEVEYLNLPEGTTLTADTLKLSVTEQGFTLKGTAKYQNIPLNINVNEKFKDKSGAAQITVIAKINDNDLKTLDIQSEILSAPYFTGTSEITAVLSFLNNGKINISVDASLKDVALDYAFLGFAKPKGIPCRAKASFKIANELVEEVSSFSLLKAQFEASGNMKMTPEGKIKTITINNIKSPKSFAKAKIDFSYKPDLSLKVTVTGDSYDLTEFFDKKKKDTAAAQKKKQKSLKDPLEDIMNTDIIIGVNKLWTNHKVPVTNFAGRAELRHGIGLHRLNMVGNYGASKDVKMNLSFEPRGSEYVLTVDSNNAGSTLKVLRLYDNMKGGNLHIEAKRDKYKNFKGHAKMRDFALADTPVFAKILSIASFSGMVDMLLGDGLTFTHLNAPFSYTFSTKNLATEDAKMFGSVLGLTMSGSYNMFTDKIEAKGLVTPAYGLNTFIGSIPLVGKVLAGADGTVFAANYTLTGSLDKPVIAINPLSTLAPNSLKELFSGE